MGLRYRKSINLGGGFRVNLSKSGIGYSWGTKGYRVTHKAGGGVRRTYSIPGTGISWVDESGSRSRKRSSRSRQSGTSRQTARTKQQQNVISGDGPVLYQSTAADVAQLADESTRDFLDSIRMYSNIRTLFKVAIWVGIIFSISTPAMLIMTVCGIAGLIIMHSKYRIRIDYDFDDYGSQCVSQLDQVMQDLMGNATIWQVDTIKANNSLKTNAGAYASVSRVKILFSKRTPYFLKTNASCYYGALKHSKVFLLPDRVVFKGKKGWGTIEYDDLSVRVNRQVFVESQKVPKDAHVIGYTWQYVNKNGSPDRRYKNNRRIPECEYGEAAVSAGNAMSAIFFLSDINKARQFQADARKLIQILEQIEADSSQAELTGEEDNEEASEPITEEEQDANPIEESQDANSEEEPEELAGDADDEPEPADDFMSFFKEE